MELQVDRCILLLDIIWRNNFSPWDLDEAAARAWNQQVFLTIECLSCFVCLFYFSVFILLPEDPLHCIHVNPSLLGVMLSLNLNHSIILEV